MSVRAAVKAEVQPAKSVKRKRKVPPPGRQPDLAPIALVLNWEDVAPDVWLVAKHTKQKRERIPTPIADLHDTHLIRAIQYLLRRALGLLAKRSISASRADVLAEIPQWRYLLEEGRRRKLHIVSEDLIEKSIAAITARKLAK